MPVGKKCALAANPGSVHAEGEAPPMQASSVSSCSEFAFPSH